LELLREFFDDCIISNRTEREWPPKSPDLNPLDFWFWGRIEAEMGKTPPVTLTELRRMVENAEAALPEEEIRWAAQAVKCRAHSCFEADRGHFEY
jgi:hypothetical protein